MRTLTLLAPALTLGLTACFDLGKLLGGDSGDAGDTGAESLSDEDTDLDGWSPAEGDCDDDNPDIYPGAQEIGDNDVDEDCDGVAAVSDVVVGPAAPSDGLASVASGALVAQPAVFESDVVVTGLGISCASAGAAGRVRVGLYDSAGGAPDVLLAETEPVSCFGGELALPLGAQLPLAAGEYWVVVAAAPDALLTADPSSPASTVTVRYPSAGPLPGVLPRGIASSAPALDLSVIGF